MTRPTATAQAVTQRRAPVVLTIARQMGSGGSYIGYAVARQLQLTYMNREILERAARALRVDDLRALEPLEETRATIWARLMRGMAHGPPELAFVAPAPRYDEADVLEVESHIIAAVAEHEDAVIVGHGAGYVLRDHPGVIRVFVHAPEPWRIAAAQRTYALPHDTAVDLIRLSDRRRSRFIDGLTGMAWTDARLYDMTIDTSVVEIDMAIDWLAQALRVRLHGGQAMPRSES